LVDDLENEENENENDEVVDVEEQIDKLAENYTERVETQDDLDRLVDGADSKIDKLLEDTAIPDDANELDKLVDETITDQVVDTDTDIAALEKLVDGGD
jgi:hypothetical protein